MRCLALDWDRAAKDYVECSPTTTVKMVRLRGGVVTVKVPLCANHREYFTEELARVGGHLDKTKRVEEVSSE